jgi:hypothetical protein
LDPDRRNESKWPEGFKPGDPPERPYFVYEETPYDYGMEHRDESRKMWTGILIVKDQGGSKSFQDGVGVTMRGDVAEQCNIYYMPKMEDEMDVFALAGSKAENESGHYNEERENQYASFKRSIQDSAKRGEETYFIRRQPGIPLAGATVWTFGANGELRSECAIVTGGLINGVEMDETGDLYFVNARLRVVDDKGTAFLAGRGGVFGVPQAKVNRNPLTGTLMKTRGKGANVLLKRSIVPLEPPPNRPPDLIDSGYAFDNYETSTWAWVEGAKWFYAGAGPIVFAGCQCPMMRFHTDWFKRTFVPETCRHSIAALDTNGNLILHIGQYGNLDSADGPKSKIPVGGDGIAIANARFIAGTDDRLVFEDHGERIMVLRLNYHAEETAGIAAK